MSRSAVETNASSNETNVEYFLMDASGNEQADDGTQEILSPVMAPQQLARDADATTDAEEARHSLLTPISSPQPLRRRRAVLSGRNILNAVTYGIHCICWWSVAVWGLDGMVHTHWEETEAYETLITPATWNAHYLWVPILITEAAFSLAQLFPHYRARPIVTGIGYRFFYTVLLQICFTFLYSFGLFVGSFITAVLTLLSLLSLLSAQHHHTAARRSGVTEYCLFKLPFFLHAGWMILMTVEHYSLLFRRYSSSPSLQLASDIVAMGALLAVAAFALTYVSDFVVPIVILWSYVRRA